FAVKQVLAGRNVELFLWRGVIGENGRYRVVLWHEVVGGNGRCGLVFVVRDGWGERPLWTGWCGAGWLGGTAVVGWLLWRGVIGGNDQGNCQQLIVNAQLLMKRVIRSEFSVRRSVA
ncbi:MAG: hypothetical protein IAF02_20175, partial [Anaerolineae bacterium]|nr:hypothetical protein [Anaerolineae bacterium]